MSAIAESQAVWIPDLIAKGYDIFNSYKRFNLIDGPRRSGKSWSLQHRVCRHLWEVQFARVIILTKTIGQGQQGVWHDLTQWILPQWIEADIGFRYTQEPRVDVNSKASFFKVRNIWGGQSECYLISLQHDSDAELKFKDIRFSMVYWVEADKFKDRKVFTVLKDQLRANGVPFQLHQMFCDCNPPEEGDEHFLHDIFIKRHGTHDTIDPHFDDKFQRIQILLEDNTKLTPEEMQEQLDAYKYDPDLYARWTEGKWVKYSAGGHFKDLFISNIHIHGNASARDPDDWEVIVPTSNCVELFTGSDPGDTNHATVFSAKRETEKGTAFDIIDELVLLDRPVSIEEYVELFLQKMDFWEKLLKERYGTEKVRWRHWSDLSAFKFNAAADNYVHQLVHQFSGGRIIFNNAGRLPGFVSQRLSLVKKLLFQQRIFISAQLKFLQTMFRNLRKGKLAHELIDPHSPEKHVFDAMTYMLAHECPMDMDQRVKPVTTRNLISIQS